MKRFEGMVLCSDMDGTLVDETNHISKENIEAISYFKKHGGKLLLATGRIPEAVMPLLSDIEPDFPCICHNGCSIYDFKTHAYISTIALSRDAVLPAEEILQSFPESGVEIMTDQGIYVVRRTAETDHHIRFEKITARHANDWSAVSGTWLKILFAKDPDSITAMQEAMKHSAFHADFTMIRTHAFYYEIFHKNASKGNALRALGSFCDIHPETVVAIGDNDNDISMLQTAKISVAPANASPGAKAAAHMILEKNNNQSCVAELIYKL